MMNWCHGYSFHSAVSDADCYKAPCLLNFWSCELLILWCLTICVWPLTGNRSVARYSWCQPGKKTHHDLILVIIAELRTQQLILIHWPGRCHSYAMSWEGSPGTSTSSWTTLAHQTRIRSWWGFLPGWSSWISSSLQHFCSLSKAIHMAPWTGLVVMLLWNVHETFQSADELVHVYQKFLRKAAFEKGTFVQDCYKHDDSAIWTDWCGEVPLQFSHMTGPLAPHGFRFLRWKHVKLEEVNSSGYSPHDPCGDDVMCLIYEHMSDPLPFQMAKLLSNFAWCYDSEFFLLLQQVKKYIFFQYLSYRMASIS